MTIEERMKELRIAKNLNQTEFAKKLGLTSVTISTTEAGKTLLTNKNINLICLTFGVREEWLREGIGEMFDKKDISLTVREILDIVEKLSPASQQMIRNLARDMFANEQRAADAAYGEADAREIG